MIFLMSDFTQNTSHVLWITPMSQTENWSKYAPMSHHHTDRHTWLDTPPNPDHTQLSPITTQHHPWFAVLPKNHPLLNRNQIALYTPLLLLSYPTWIITPPPNQTTSKKNPPLTLPQKNPQTQISYNSTRNKSISYLPSLHHQRYYQTGWKLKQNNPSLLPRIISWSQIY